MFNTNKLIFACSLLIMLLGCNNSVNEDTVGFNKFCEPNNNSKCGLTYNGKLILEPHYKITLYAGAYPHVLKEQQWYFVDENGTFSKEGYIKISYPTADRFKVAKVFNRTYKFGLAKLDGTIIISPRYLVISNFEEGYASFSETTEGGSPKVGFIDTNGKVIIPPRFCATRGYSFVKGVAAVCEADSRRWGYINTQGEWLIKPIFTEAHNYVGSVAVVEQLIEAKDGRYKGVIDNSGNLLVPFDYSHITISNNGDVYWQKDTIKGKASLEEFLQNH